MAAPKRKPLIRSLNALRLLATGITALSLGGMGAYANAHLYSATAPLQPVAPLTEAPATVTTARTTTGRIQLSAGVPTTTAAPVTKTHRS